MCYRDELVYQADLSMIIFLFHFLYDHIFPLLRMMIDGHDLYGTRIHIDEWHVYVNLTCSL